MPRATDTPQTKLSDASAKNGSDPGRDANGSPVADETVLVSPVVTGDPAGPSPSSPKTNGKRRAGKLGESKPPASVEPPKRKARAPKPAAEPATAAESTPQPAAAEKKPARPRKRVADAQPVAEESVVAEQQPAADLSSAAGSPAPEPGPKKRSPVSKRATGKQGTSRPAAKRKPKAAEAQQPEPTGGARKSAPTSRKKSPAKPAGTASRATAKRQPRSRATPAPSASKPEETPELSRDVWAAETPAPVAAVPEQPAVDDPDVALELCEIAWWRGYVKSEFYADAVGPEGNRFQPARSPKFWWRRAEPPPTTPRARAALDALVEKLVKAGWEQDGRGYEWYQLRFKRRGHISLLSRYAGPLAPL